MDEVDPLIDKMNYNTRVNDSQQFTRERKKRVCRIIIVLNKDRDFRGYSKGETGRGTFLELNRE